MAPSCGAKQIVQLFVWRLVACATLVVFPTTASADQLASAPQPAEWLIRAYQRFASRSKASTCPMTPSCSEYGRIAFDNYPFWRASIATTDRLSRCGHDTFQYEIIDGPNGPRYVDPLRGVSAVETYRESAPPAHDSTSFHPHPVSKSSGQEEERQIRLARELFFSRNYELALLEYLRLVSQYPGSSFAMEARETVLTIYCELGRFDDAVVAARNWLGEEEGHAQERVGIRYLLGNALLRMKNERAARGELEEVVRADTGEISDRAQLLIAFSYAQEQRWGDAIESFNLARQRGVDSVRVSRLVQVCREAQAEKSKNPILAGVLAAVPGLGYLYAGSPGTAGAAAVMDVLLLGSAYKAFGTGNAPLGSLLGVIGLGWYVGGIYGSIWAAERNNEAKQRQALAKLDLGFKR